MTITLDDPELVQQLERTSASAGESVQSFVLSAVKDKLAQPIRSIRPLRHVSEEELRLIQDKIKAMPVLDNRSEDELLGYDEYGLFSE